MIIKFNMFSSLATILNRIVVLVSEKAESFPPSLDGDTLGFLMASGGRVTSAR